MIPSQTSTPDSAYATAPSRTADKFVLRISLELNNAIADVARSQYRNANSEIALAAISMLEDHRRLITMRNSLYNRLGAAVAEDVLANIHRIDPYEGKPHTANVRFPEGLREKLTSKGTTKRDLVAQACSDWVFYSCQIEALLKCCEDPGIKYPSPHARH